MEILIRQETGADFEPVYQVVKTAFQAAEHTTHDEQDLVVRLRNSAVFIPELSMVAVVGGKIVGHALFTRLTIKGDAQEFPSLSLAPVSVVPAMQGKGIGTGLIVAGHNIAREMKFSSVILVGHPGYYPRFGYLPARRFGITSPFEVPDEAFMACELQENGLAGVAGVVQYPKEFLL